MENKVDSKKKKPFILRFFKGLLIFFFLLIAVITFWFCFCNFNKVSNLKVLPNDYSLYLRTDSIFNAVNPVIDLKAADILLAEENLQQFREMFYTLRESNLRNNPVVSYALSRRIDAALYENQSFLGIMDMGWLAGASRLLPVVYRFFSIPNLIYAVNSTNSCFEYRLDDMIIYIKPYKNLIIVTNDNNLLKTSLTSDNEAGYTKTELAYLKKNLDQPFRIAADGKKLINLLENDNPYMHAFTEALSAKELSEINFGITDDDINISIKIPFEIATNTNPSANAIINLIKRESQVPQVLEKLPESVQYYTFVTAGSLEELKNAAFSILSDKPDLEKKWTEANNISKMVFNEKLDNILFSWTDDEYAVLGIEGKSEPIIAVKIGDEIKRKYIFDTILSSIIFKTDNSLLLDGIRLPRIEFPSFLKGLLESFDVNLPRPYYMVKDNFVYFSQSPENLALINASINTGAKLSKNANWEKVSTQQNLQSSLSLFYNLERSLPFFLKTKSIVTDILQLYNIGRVDITTEKNTIYLKLQAAAIKDISTKIIPGFPMDLEGKTNFTLHKSNVANAKTVFWQEGSNQIKALNTQSLQIISKTIENLYSITLSQTQNELWALTKNGTLYLLNDKLEVQPNFPLICSTKPLAYPSAYKNKLLISGEEGVLVLVDSDGTISHARLDTLNDIKNPGEVRGSYCAFYEKGFMGTIHLLNLEKTIFDAEKASSFNQNGGENNEGKSKYIENYNDNYFTYDVDGIAFGNPAILNYQNNSYTGFITQSGEMSVWDNKTQKLREDFPVQLDGVFYLNVKAFNDSFVALAADGTLYKIGLDASVIPLSIPYFSAKSGYLTVWDFNEDGKEELFVCGEGNTIYGFDKDFEFINGFPLSGYGTPIFIDLNGDKKADCLTLSIDNKLNAYKIQ
ncbi:MAG: VCBS repeat-containing protein [Treponema sp.]|nr:VCBS repeat-containing protein [Treponema sp.]